MKICSVCKTENINEAQYCRACGCALINGIVEPVGSVGSAVPKPSIVNKNELWGWLKKKFSRKYYYTPNQDPMAEGAFIEKVQTRLKENEIPATIEPRQIRWDFEGRTERVFMIEVASRVEREVPMSYLVGMRRVGKYTFVEEKSFIAPPMLPKIELGEVSETSLMNIGVGCIVAALVLFFLANIFVAAIAGVAGVAVIVKDTERVERNKKILASRTAWTQAWNDWEEKVFRHVYMDDATGNVSRVIDAVHDCVEQVSKELFADIVKTEEDNSSMNDLEALLKRRRDEYR